MEFLYKLYETQYFGIGLFIVITILTFLFLVILFFGKKDEKVRKLEETKKLQLEQEPAFKEVNDNGASLDIPVIEQPLNEVSEQVEPIAPIEEPVVAPIEEESANEFKMEVNESLQNIEPTVEVEEPTPAVEPILEPNNEVNLDDLFQTNGVIEEHVLEPVVEAQEENHIEEVQPVVNEEVTQVEEPVTSTEPSFKPFPDFELPKKMEMPKLNEEEKAEEQTIEPVSNLENIIPNETYNIDE